MGGSLEGKLFHQTTCLQNVNLSERKHLTIKKAKKKKNYQAMLNIKVWVGFGGLFVLFFYFFLRGGGVLKGNGVCLWISMCVNKPRQFSNDLQERLYYVHTSWNSVAWRSHIRKSWMTSWAQMKTACFYILTYWVHYFVWDLHFLTIGNFPCFTL